MGCADPCCPTLPRRDSRAGNGLYKMRGLRRVAQRFPKPLDRIVDTAIEINEGARRPDLGAQLLSRDDLAMTAYENLQYVQRLVLKLDPSSLRTQLSRWIQFELAEANNVFLLIAGAHRQFADRRPVEL
jgi:hypothetical protein